MMFEVTDALPEGVSEEFLSALDGQSGSLGEPYIYTQ
jgi:hypothetical protein